MRGRLLFFTALFVGALLAGAPEARTAGLDLPPRFELWTSAPGVEVYESEDGAEFVQLVDLRSGARLDFWYKLAAGPSPINQGRSEGIYGGNSPAFERHYLASVWEEVAAAEAVCLANGQFFRDTINGRWVDPTELAFPLKSDGVMVSEGYERYRFRRHRQMLALWPAEAAIMPLNRAALYSSTAPDIIAGLAETASVRSSEPLGRTFVGTADRDGDGRSETVLIYSGEAVTQQEATATLRAFGANAVMMLDGGGSNQLLCEGSSLINRVRPLPQMIATVPGRTVVGDEGPVLEMLKRYLSERRRRLGR
ncbi:MAG TPA: phosphodiester glycosidase family protein [Candidatus Sulfomarinibacteraceae bacterium]|nr:phosphodiester glycosidase family protein [Candidatus Sulfomarinibacteraceae bacterium]